MPYHGTNMLSRVHSILQDKLSLPQNLLQLECQNAILTQDTLNKLFSVTYDLELRNIMLFLSIKDVRAL